MDLVQLRAFAAVARDGNLTRAAARLHVTQPAVSLQLKSLQIALGLHLFSRIPSGMMLTDDGARLLPLAERILAGAAELAQAAQLLQTGSADTLSGTLAIGTILDPEFTRLGAFLKQLVENYPQLSTELRHNMSGGVLADVANGNLDVGYYLGLPPAEFHYLTLTSFKYKVVAPHGWKNRVSGRDWTALARLPWIWTPPQSAHNRLLSRIFAQRHVHPHKVALVDQESSMLDLVKSGVGLSLIRETTALREAHAHGLAIADQVGIASKLSFIALKSRRREPAINAVFALLANLWTN